MCLAGSCPGWCGYLHALNLVSLVRVSLVRAGWCALLVRVVRVLVGSGYLHALNLVSLVGVSLVRAGSCWLVWLPACLEPRILVAWCALLVRVSLVGSCPWFVWLPACLEPRVLVAWCALLVRVSLVCVSLVRVLVGSDYLHTLNLVSLLVRALPW